MKYFMGFALCLSIIVNIVYMKEYKTYSIVIDNHWNQKYTITFDSYTAPVVGGDLRRDSVDGMITTYVDYQFETNDSIHPYSFYYKDASK